MTPGGGATTLPPPADSGTAAPQGLHCRVRRLCLTSGLDTKSWGVWGGFYLYAGRPPLADRPAVEAFLAGVDPLTEDGADELPQTAQQTTAAA